MIENICFSSYRAFSQKQNMRLAPITVVFGKNNIGKSAILKLPLLIQSALSQTSEFLFAKKHNDILLCDEFRDVVYGKANKSVQITLSSHKNDCLSFSFIIDKADTGGWNTIIESWELQDGNGEVLRIIWDYDTGKYYEEGRDVEVLFHGLCPQNTSKQEWVDIILKDFSLSIDYLGPLRTNDMKSEFRLAEEADHFSSGRSGEYNYTYLVEDYFTPERKLFNKVSDWYKDCFEGWKIGVDSSRDPLFSLTLSLGKMKNNLIDMGEGIVQSLPVVTSICRDYGCPTLVELEEPGTHLHPAAQGPLAELIADEVLSNPSKRFLIETHSLNFILRLRALVAMGKLPLDFFALYYVEFNNELAASNLISTEVQDDGSVNNWPKNVFNETYVETLNIRNAQLKRINR